VSHLTGATSSCETIDFKTCSIELENLETGMHAMVDLSTGKFIAQTVDNQEDKIYSILYAKDKLDNGYHELSMVSDLSSSSGIKK